MRARNQNFARPRSLLSPLSLASDLSPGAAPISAPYSVAPADEHGDVFVHGLEHIYTVLQEHL
jgi:hypothetical protein